MKSSMAALAGGMIAAVISGVAAGAAAAQQDVDIKLIQFGAQNVYRPGDFAGIEIQLISNLDDAVNAEVVWEVTEASGDIVEYSRVLALGPGQPASAWLYSKLLPNVSGRSVFTLRAYEDIDGKRGRELGATRVTPNMVARAPMLRTNSLICFVGGQRTASINDYNISVSNPSYPDLGHEFLLPVPGVAPIDLPDRWEGLDQFEAVVWTDATPGALGSAKARAIREYVKRGGHFIIILPQVGNDWQLGSLPVNDLSDLLPSVPPQTVATDYLELLPVLSKRRTLPARANQPISIRIFDESRLDRGWEPLIAMPAGDVVVIDRRFGFGHLTIIGIDIASQQLTAQAVDGGGGVFEGEMIWNIVLGRRQDTLSGSQLKTLDDDKKFYTSSRMSIDLGSGGLIREKINLRGQAFAGIGLAFVLFVAYWLLAGPVGYGLLRGAKKVKHAWLAFALTSAVFTVIAWGGVWLFSQKDTQVQHLTFLDIIAETDPANSGEDAPSDAPSPGSARMTSWFTLFLPGYGQPRLTLESNENSGRNILTAFAPPGEEIGGFANVDRYKVSIDDPANYRVPARSTTKEMYARYLGPIPPRWSSGDESIGFTITEPIVVQAGRITSGRIIHNFPRPLRDVKVFVVQANHDTPKQYSDADGTGKSATFSRNLDEGRMPNVVRSLAIAAIQPLQELPLAAGAKPTARGGRFDTFIEDHYETSKDDSVTGLTGQGSISRAQADRFLEMLSFYQMITPPEYRRQRAELSIDNSDRPYTVRRHFGREIDLSEWLTRPCIIVYGKLENSELPLPLLVNGKTTKGTGLTIVRWIYPLPMTTKTATSQDQPNES